MTARMSLSALGTQAILGITRNSDETRFQLIFDFELKKLAISYYNGTTWEQRDIENW